MTEKSNAVEFWRFLFTMFIVEAHAWLCTALGSTSYVFCAAGYGVEFFFILSGFLMMANCTKQAHENSVKSAVRYTAGRFVRFAPMYYLTLSVMLVYRCRVFSAAGWSSEQIADYFKNIWPELFMLNGVHYTLSQANLPSWYLSALLFCGLFLYALSALLLKWKQRPIPYLLSLSLISGWIYYVKLNSNMIGSNLVFRGIACMSAGAICHCIYVRLAQMQTTVRMTEILVVVEAICVIGIFTLMPFRSIDRWSMLLIPFYMGLIVVMFMNLTPLTKILNHKISALLGKISFAVYLGHMTVLVKFGWLPRYDLAANPVRAYAEVGLASIGYGLVLMLVLAMIRKSLSFITVKKS